MFACPTHGALSRTHGIYRLHVYHSQQQINSFKTRLEFTWPELIVPCVRTDLRILGVGLELHVGGGGGRVGAPDRNTDEIIEVRSDSWKLHGTGQEVAVTSRPGGAIFGFSPRRVGRWPKTASVNASEIYELHLSCLKFYSN